MIYLNLPEWLWVIVAVYFGVSAVNRGLTAYSRWLGYRLRDPDEEGEGDE